jgi:hypothetical protein
MLIDWPDGTTKGCNTPNDIGWEVGDCTKARFAFRITTETPYYIATYEMGEVMLPTRKWYFGPSGSCPMEVLSARLLPVDAQPVITSSFVPRPPASCY